MSYEVTATRKRPASFDSLAGQEFVVATLKNSIKTGRIAHAYLFSGPRGVGKTSAARILAKALNCVKGPTDEPCGVCPNCLEIAKGNSLDVIEIDGASNTSVNDVREIKDEVLFAPNSSRYKIYIIDEVHMLSNSAFNALLKTIEEPPPYIVFVFATTEIHKVPATIRSRCQQFNFRLIPIDTIKGLLRGLCDEMKLAAEDDALLWIAKESTGSLRDAYTLFDQVVSFSEGEITAKKIREKLGILGLDRMNEIGELLAEGKHREAMEILDEVFSSGVSIEQLAIDLSEYFRNILFLKQGIRKESLLGYSPERFSRKVLDSFQPRQLERALSLLLDLYRNLRYSLNPRFEIELAVSRLAELRNYLSRELLLEKIQTLRKELRTGFAVASVGSEPAAGDPQAAETASAEGGEDGNPELEGSGSPADPASASAEGGISPERRAAIIQAVRKKKLALSSALEKAMDWKAAGDELVLEFDNKFSADFVNQDLHFIALQIKETLGREFRLSVKVGGPREASEEPPRTQEDDERVEMIKKVFRGEVVK